MRKPRLIAIDVDGTLVDSETRLQKRVSEAIKAVIEDGALVTLATGRMVSASREYIEALDITLPTIALNGSFVGFPDNGRPPIYHKPISRPSSKALIEAAWDAGATLIFVCCDRAFCRNITDLTERALKTWIVNINPLEHPEQIADRRPTAILMAGEENEINSLDGISDGLTFEDIDKYLFPSIRFFPMHYLEIRARGTSKGRGLSVLADYFGVSGSDILAIGDYINDLPMVDVAGTFAAPSSAHEEILAAADYISPLSNDEGAVAEILDKLYFGKDNA